MRSKESVLVKLTGWPESENVNINTEISSGAQCSGESRVWFSASQSVSWIMASGSGWWSSVSPGGFTAPGWEWAALVIKHPITRAAVIYSADRSAEPGLVLSCRNTAAGLRASPDCTGARCWFTCFGSSGLFGLTRVGLSDGFISAHTHRTTNLIIKHEQLIITEVQ